MLEKCRDSSAAAPDLAQLIGVFGRIGVLSFGGPAAQIALMHEELVEKRKWLEEGQFLRALSLCMLLPGPEAMQLASYAGWRLRGVGGGLIAGGLFVFPGALLIFALAFAYLAYGELPLVQAAFTGIKATVIALLIQALFKMGQRSLRTSSEWAVAGLAFFALFAFALPFPLVIFCAGLYGFFSTPEQNAPPVPSVPFMHPLRNVVIFGLLWGAPLLMLWILQEDFLLQTGLFFSKLAVVTFGGAYAVLAYMSQTVVQEYGWISAPQMIDALGLAETTPGPLILVTQFVAILAGENTAGVSMGLCAGALALWVTFVPCFLWIFSAGPYIETLTARPRLTGALQAISCAVVGVILNLSLWFALQVLFEELACFAIPVNFIA